MSIRTRLVSSFMRTTNFVRSCIVCVKVVTILKSYIKASLLNVLLLLSTEEHHQHQTLNAWKTAKSGKVVRSLKILYFNAHSIRNKLLKLHDLLGIVFGTCHNVACVAEAWLNSSLPDSLIVSSFNYSIFQCDRKHENGSGCVIFVHIHSSVPNCVCLIQSLETELSQYV